MIPDTSAQDRAIEPPRGRNLRRLLLAVAAVVAVAGATALAATAWTSARASVNASRLRIEPVTRGTLVRDAAVNGRVVAAVSPTLYATAGGTVALKVNAGDAVKAGQVLAQIDSPELANALAREQATFDELRADLARQEIVARKQRLTAQRDADQAEIERVAAQRAYDRIEKAGIVGVVSKNEFDKAKDTLRSAEIRGRHAAAAALLENDDVQLQLRTRRAQLQRQGYALDEAKRRVATLTVHAPMDGVVGSLAVAERAVVAANAPLLTLVDLSKLEVDVEIPETYVADLGIGMNVDIASGDLHARGRLAAISPEVVKNEVLARVRFTGAQPAGLRQSQRVAARLLIDERHDVLMLPRGPFVEAHGGRYVYVVQDGVARRQPVTLGALSVNAVEVTAGLHAGDRVVVSGSEAFANAAAVKIND